MTKMLFLPIKYSKILYTLSLLAFLIVNFCCALDNTKLLNKINLNIIDSVKLPFPGVTNILNISKSNLDILLYTQNSKILHIVDSNGNLKKSIHLIGDAPDQIGESLFFGDFLNENSILLCSPKGYSIYSNEGNFIKRIIVNNTFINANGQCDVVYTPDSIYLVHDVFEDTEGLLSITNYGPMDKNFSKSKILTKFNITGNNSNSFVQYPMINGNFKYWQDKPLLNFTPHFVDKEIQNVYVLFSPLPKIYIYNISDLTINKSIDVFPESFADYHDYSDPIKTLNGNSFFNEILVSEEYIIITYTTPLSDEYLNTFQNGRYGTRRIIVISKIDNHHIDDFILPKQIGYNFRLLYNNKFIATRNQNILEDSENDYLYKIDINPF